MPYPAGKKNTNFLAGVIVLVFGLAVIIVGGFLYFKFHGAKTRADNALQPAISFFESAGREVTSQAEITSPIKLIYAERIVTEVGQTGDNKYTTNYYLTDLKGENKYRFYQAGDLTLESAYPYIDNSLIILKEFGQAENRALGLDGLPKDVFLPPVYFGTDFILSDDHKNIAYLESKKADKEDVASTDFKYLIKIKNLTDNTVKEFDPLKIKNNDQSFSQYFPLAFSADQKILYIYGTDEISDNMWQNTTGLYALNISSMESEEVYYFSPEESEEKDRFMLLAVYPILDLALVSRAPQMIKNDELVFRTQLQTLNLQTKKFSDLYIDETADHVGMGGKILSPDGQKLILLKDAFYDQGLSYYDISARKTYKLTDQGEFIAWLSDNETVIYQKLLSNQENETILSEKIELHALNIRTKEDYKIYTQNVLYEGASLNRAGDTYYSWIGSL
ncbi:MAG: hypothetical protein WC528_01325 [Patescibacteria group bacterium]